MNYPPVNTPTGMYNPCKEITLDAKDYFTSCINHLDNEGISLFKVLHGGGYTLEDLKDLIRNLYKLEDFYGEFVGNDSTDIAMATRVFSYIEKAFGSDVLVPARGSDLPSITYGISDLKRHDEVFEILGAPLGDVPLFINGSLLQRAIADWRLKLGK